jgi:hypothetical protein
MQNQTLNDNEKNSVLDELLFMAATGNLNYQSDDDLKQEKRDLGFNLIRHADGFTFLTPVISLMSRSVKQCKNGQACGNACISKAKVCRKNLGAKQAAKAQVAKTKTTKQTKSKSAPQAIGKTGYSADEQSKLATPHLQNLYGLAMGQSDTRDPDKVKIQDAKLINSNVGTYQYEKIRRLKKAGLEEMEAHGVAAWIDHSYKPINQEIYAPTGDKYGEGAGVRAAQGIHKLPSYKHSEMVKEGNKAGSSLLPEGELRRGVKIPDLDAFLKPYEEAAGKPEFKEPTFFATTARQSLGFTDPGRANVLYVIKAKSDGTGQGRAVDKYKNQAFEGEVLYPPYSRFKINRVERQSQGFRLLTPPGQIPDAPEFVKKMTSQEFLAFIPKIHDARQSVNAVASAMVFNEPGIKKKQSEARKKIAALGFDVKGKKWQEVAYSMAFAYPYYQTTPGQAKIYMEEL